MMTWIQNNVPHKGLNGLMMGISWLGNGGMVWIVLGVVLLLAGWKLRRRLYWGLAVLLSLGSNALVCNLLLKPLVARTRPYDVLGYDLLIPPLSDYSFPSGHTSASFAAATAIYALHPGWGKAAYVFAALMGISRLYLGVHFVTDVVVGAVIGVVMAKLTLLLMKRTMKKRI
ncbi:phosphatase PAP2 family protein [Anaerotignum lactatifermentans]|uniref:Phosphatase PAP2 family protein n=2 Tax=Anaerotignum lactatifermentans TaxID=160404 RepID=A0ABS2GBA1_9FIRM|nr:phosphatase PAP2 family protein [Anaerotignum lactatifermentans]MBM6878754.1 phosphatase PAP2 family protein [Anaerotignum lactatifermentans]MBM6951818.1 phosphatase PAP2 family protein [Anaerotignum lactatifermentans]